MALKLESKKAIVDQVNKVAVGSVFAIVASYRGLTVAQMTELRSRARKIGVFLKVVRNTLARRAVHETNFACLEEALVGPMVLLFTQEDAGEAARLMRDFAKENKLLEVQALSFGATLLPGKELEAVANLPSRNEAIALFMSVLNAPVTKLVRTLVEPHAQFVRVVAAIGDKKQAA
jgi:large subunit ribosomal protein L10